MLILKDKVIQHVPKTAGIALKRLVSFEPEKVVYSTNHKPLSFLKHFQDSSELPVFAMLREPIDWYNSWWNFTKDRRENCAITSILHKYSNTMEEFIDNILDLTLFFKKYSKALDDVKVHMIRDSKDHIIYFFDDFQKITPDFFNHQSLYEFLIRRQIDTNTIIYRFPDQLNMFLHDIGYPKKLPIANITEYKDIMSQEIKNKIYTKEKFIQKLYNNISENPKK